MKVKKEKPVKVAEGWREHKGTWNYKGVTVRVKKHWHKPSRHTKGYYVTSSNLSFSEESGEGFDLNNVYGGIRNAVKIIDRAESTGELYEHRGYAPVKVVRKGDNWEKIA